MLFGVYRGGISIIKLSKVVPIEFAYKNSSFFLVKSSLRPIYEVNLVDRTLKYGPDNTKL
jgi:hypothetical protein